MNTGPLTPKRCPWSTASDLGAELSADQALIAGRECPKCPVGVLRRLSKSQLRTWAGGIGGIPRKKVWRLKDE